MVQITIELDQRKKAGKENPAAERGRGPEAGIAEDIFYHFSLGFRGRKSRQEGKGEEETSPAQGRREGSGAVSCESETNDAFLLTLLLDVAVPVKAPWPLVPGISASLMQGALAQSVPSTSIPLGGQPALWGRGAQGTCQTAPSRLLGQESWGRGTGIAIASPPA